MRNPLFPAAALWAALSFFPGAAQEAKSYAPPPDQWLYVAETDDYTSSFCIGSPRNPLCAVETLLACFQRNDFNLCRMVDDKAMEYSQVFQSPLPRDRYLAYRIVQAIDIANAPHPDDPEAKPGDVVLVIDQRDGALGVSAPPTNAPDQRFVTRRMQDGRWKIVNWGGPDD